MINKRNRNSPRNSLEHNKLAKSPNTGQWRRLQMAIKLASDTEIARFFGISRQTVCDARLKDKIPSRWLPKIIQKTDISIDWLLTGEGEMYRTKRPKGEGKSEPSALAENEYVFVPLFEGLVTAGPDGGILFDKPDDMYPFKKWWIIKKVGHNPERHKALTLVRIRGDSMVPTIYPGEVVLVDTWEAERVEIKDGKIYLVRMPDGTITVKRVILSVRDNSAYLVCLSDNQNYEPFKFLLDKPIQWYILGRIRWVGREID